jgi:FecR protein
MMNCAETRTALDNSGPHDDLSAEVRRHLEGCLDCRELSAEYERLDSDLAALYESGFKPGMLDATLAGLEERPRPRTRRRGWLVAAAAAMLLLAGGGWLAHRRFARGEQFKPYDLAITDSAPASFKNVEGARVWTRAGSRVAVIRPRVLRVTKGAVLLKIEPGRGDFTVELPAGSVSVLGTEFSVSVGEDGTRVAVRSGKILLKNASGSLALTPGQAGTLKRRVEGEAPTAPASLPGITVAGETLWRPWRWLDAEERAERLAHLRTLMSREDYDARVGARKHLAGAGEDGLKAAIDWTAAKTPRLRLEAIFFLRSAPPDHAGARGALEKVIKNRREQPGIRDQARVSLDELERRAAREVE